MIYKIMADYENYCAFDLPMKKVLLSIGNKVPPQKLMHFYRHNIQLGAHWEGIEASFTPVEGVNKQENIPDITTWSPGTLILSDKAKQSLSEILAFGECLPVKTPAGLHWILNISKEIAADESSSHRTLAAGQVLAVDNLVISFEDQQKMAVFKTSYDGFRSVFCNQKFKDIVNQCNLRGIIFSENLTTAFS